MSGVRYNRTCTGACWRARRLCAGTRKCRPPRVSGPARCVRQATEIAAPQD